MFLLLFAAKKKNRRKQNEFDNIVSEFLSFENSQRLNLSNRLKENLCNLKIKIENNSHRSSRQVICF